VAQAQHVSVGQSAAWRRASPHRRRCVPHPATQASTPVPAARNAAWWVRSRCPLRRCSLWKVVGDLFADLTSMVGNKKPPSAQQPHEGCASVDLISQAPTRMRITTSFPEVFIAPRRQPPYWSNVKSSRLPAPRRSGVAVVARYRCRDACMATDSAEEDQSSTPVVISISPMAHFAVGFFALGLLVPVLTWPVTAPLLIIPVLLSALIVRLRTQADGNGVTVRTLLGSRSVRWEEIDGLRFRRGSWGRAQLKCGRELRLPAVTFATLPQLTQASAGRVPNPYAD